MAPAVKRRKRKQWTAESRALAEYWARKGKTASEIATIVGMGESSIYYLLGPLVTYRPRKERQTRGPRIVVVEPRGLIPLDVEQDRDDRIAARQAREQRDMMRGDATASFFGDPPLGYSALDRKRA